MKAPPKFKITIEGDLYHVLSRENASAQIGWYMTKLLTGVELDDNQFASWSLKVKVEEQDQGIPIHPTSLDPNPTKGIAIREVPDE